MRNAILRNDLKFDNLASVSDYPVGSWLDSLIELSKATISNNLDINAVATQMFE